MGSLAESVHTMALAGEEKNPLDVSFHPGELTDGLPGRFSSCYCDLDIHRYGVSHKLLWREITPASVNRPENCACLPA